MKKCFIVVFLSLLVVGCADKKVGERVIEIERVFMNEPGVYSFMYKADGQLVLRGGDSYTRWLYTLIDDVPPDKPMWVKIEEWDRFIDPNFFKYEIHIHAASDVEGGGWNHGKHGQGTTVVVQ